MNAKKWLNLSCLLVVTAGVTFKIMHYPGANILLILASLLMLAGTLGFALGDNRDAEVPHSINYVLVVAQSIFILSALFKTMHWEGGDVLVQLSLLMAIVVPISFFFNKDSFAISKQYVFISALFIFELFGLLSSSSMV